MLLYEVAWIDQVIIKKDYLSLDKDNLEAESMPHHIPELFLDYITIVALSDYYHVQFLAMGMRIYWAWSFVG